MLNDDLEKLSKPELIALLKQIVPKDRNEVMESEIIRAKQEEINRLHDRFKLANRAMKEGLVGEFGHYTNAQREYKFYFRRK